MSQLPVNPGPLAPEPPGADEARREFLRRSVYAAYATPVLVALLVERASAKKSLPCPPFCPRPQPPPPTNP
ncbi:MAG: hypothetical protein ACYDA8_13470 [Deferrisomatales bacterium]